MESCNRIILLGNLTRDPELRYVGKRTAVCDVGLAVDNCVRRNDEWVEETTFVDVTLWGRTAEIAVEYFRQGSPVLNEGRLRHETWEKDEQKRSKLKVVCDRMQMLGTGKNGNEPAIDRAQSQAITSAAEGDTPSCRRSKVYATHHRAPSICEQSLCNK